MPNILSVGASTESGRKTSFSNFGKRTVHVFAPGRNVISAGVGEYLVCGELLDLRSLADGYLVNQGTSFAAPHVAGVAALVWSKYPELTVEQVVKSVLESCKETRELG